MNPVVLMFILFPIAMDLFEKAKMPRAMGPGVVLGALATAACSMPGTTSDQNVIAVQMLGTSPMAAAVPGFYRWRSCPDPEHRYDERYF